MVMTSHRPPLSSPSSLLLSSISSPILSFFSFLLRSHLTPSLSLSLPTSLPQPLSLSLHKLSILNYRPTIPGKPNSLLNLLRLITSSSPSLSPLPPPSSASSLPLASTSLLCCVASYTCPAPVDVLLSLSCEGGTLRSAGALRIWERREEWF